MVNVVGDLQRALEAAARTQQGERVLAGHDEDFEIAVGGRATVHVAIAGGRMTVGLGPSPRRTPLQFTRVEVDEDTLREILCGRVSPVEAMEQGRLFLRTRLYGGALITILLRVAYDQAREERLAQVWAEEAGPSHYGETKEAINR